MYAMTFPGGVVTQIEYYAPTCGAPNSMSIGNQTLFAVESVYTECIVEYQVGGALTLQFNAPAALIAADQDDTAYVSECCYYGSGNLQIDVYKSGQTSPSRVITEGITSPVAMTVSPAGELVVSNGTNVVQYGKGRSKPTRTITAGIYGAAFMTWDKYGRMLVMNQGNNSVSIYRRGATSPSSTITQGISGPSSIAVGPTQTVYVANASARTITEYDREGGTVSREVKDRNAETVLSYVDANDTLYTLESGDAIEVVEVYPSKQTLPSQKIVFAHLQQGFSYAVGTPW
jgi:hypothetical protein